MNKEDPHDLRKKLENLAAINFLGARVTFCPYTLQEGLSFGSMTGLKGDDLVVYVSESKHQQGYSVVVDHPESTKFATTEVTTEADWSDVVARIADIRLRYIVYKLKNLTDFLSLIDLKELFGTLLTNRKAGLDELFRRLSHGVRARECK